MEANLPKQQKQIIDTKQRWGWYLTYNLDFDAIKKLKLQKFWNSGQEIKVMNKNSAFFHVSSFEGVLKISVEKMAKKNYSVMLPEITN